MCGWQVISQLEAPVHMFAAKCVSFRSEVPRWREMLWCQPPLLELLWDFCQPVTRYVCFHFAIKFTLAVSLHSGPRLNLTTGHGYVDQSSQRIESRCYPEHSLPLIAQFIHMLAVLYKKDNTHTEILNGKISGVLKFRKRMITDHSLAGFAPVPHL